MIPAIDLDSRFDYHAADAAKALRHQEVRSALKEMARMVLELVPAGREQSLALTALEEAMMWANAGIARAE